jgi:hypothetical protein
MLSMQVVFLGAALLGFGLTIKYRRFLTIRFGLLLVLTLWAEYSLVLGWGRFSLDTVPVLALIFGIGIDEWMKQKFARSEEISSYQLGGFDLPRAQRWRWGRDLKLLALTTSGRRRGSSSCHTNGWILRDLEREV